MQFAIKYIVIIVAIALIRYAYNDFYKIKKKKLFIELTALVTIFIINLVKSAQQNVYKILALTLVETLFCCVFTIFFDKISDLISHPTETKFRENIKIIVTLLCLLPVSLADCTIGVISLGRLLAVFFVLFTAKAYGLVGSSVTGSATAVAFYASCENSQNLCELFCFVGLLAGLIVNFSKYTQFFLFLFVSAALVLFNNNINAAFFYELFIALIILFAIPDRFYNFLPRDLSAADKYFCQNSLKNFIANKYWHLIDTILKVSKIAQRNNFLDKNDLSEISNKIKIKFCENCDFKSDCTYCTKEIHNFMQTHCCQKENIHKFVMNFCEKNQLKNKTQKNFLFKQLETLNKILYNFSKECKIEINFDFFMAKKIFFHFKKSGVCAQNVVCYRNKLNKTFVEIEVFEKDKLCSERIDLCNLLKNYCGKNFAPLVFTTAEGICTIATKEAPRFCVNIGVFQHICTSEKECGDNFVHFYDKNGRAIFVLSDGMGTGAKAALTSVLSCELISELIKADVNLTDALDFANSHLLFNSSEEIFAAIDVVSIDLFSGETFIKKAGGPLTLIKKGNNLVTFDEQSLPIGILESVNIAEKKEILANNDKILIISDGALCPNDDWIKDEFKNWENESAESFAKKIVQNAVKNRENFIDDDITAIAICLKKTNGNN